MSPAKNAGTAKRDYEVGFGRPPAASRFKPGQSGNPHGRRKGSKNLGQLLVDALSARVTVTEHGRTRRITKQEVIVLGIVNGAARRDPKAIRQLMMLLNQHREGVEPVPATDDQDPHDLAILNDYLKRYGEAPSSESPAENLKEQRDDYPNAEAHQ